MMKSKMPMLLRIAMKGIVCCALALVVGCSGPGSCRPEPGQVEKTDLFKYLTSYRRGTVYTAAWYLADRGAPPIPDPSPWYLLHWRQHGEVLIAWLRKQDAKTLADLDAKFDEFARTRSPRIF